jgi:putative transposase
MDWHSSKILSWRVSNTLDIEFCIEALEQALRDHGKTEIFNNDQGAQFASRGFVGLLESHGIQVSMDGRGRVQDNIFIERLWWRLKYHYLYLHTFDNGSELRRGLQQWVDFYNPDRSHQSLDNLTQDEVFYGIPHPLAMAA